MNIKLEIPKFNGRFQVKEVFLVDLLYSSKFNGSFQVKEVFPVDLLYSSTILRSMDYCIPNIFEDGGQCSKEDIFVDWNSPPINYKHLDEDYELCKQVEEDDNENSFV